MRSARLFTIVVLVAIGCKGGSGGGGDAGPGDLCGNGASDPGEVCDDGNTTGGDGCSADCASDESCGNQRTDTGVGEVCDDGNAVGGDGCSDDCRSDESCGNGITDQVTGETCDDGNSIPMDGCSANCQSNETCGNGVTDAGEACDTMNVATAACDPDCTAPMCGDGVRNAAASEACDDGDTVNSDGCVACALARCGDGFRRTSGPAGALEQCDDGNGSQNDSCLTSCISNVCHDGFRDPGSEECDDGDTDDSDDCVDACRAARCGDGHVWNGVEGCDDGATNPGDGCSGSCQVESMPVVYVVTDPAALINMASDCDGNGVNDNMYDACVGGQIGFRWQDTGGFFPSQIVIEWNRGIACSDNMAPAQNTYLNGGYTGTFTVNDPGFTPGCQCLPVEELHTWTLSGVGNYTPGGDNAFVLDGFPNCTGMSLDDGFGGFARITVYP
jgi:cysteine-rich repeat protein